MASIEVIPWGVGPNDAEVVLYRITGASLRVSLSNFGATVQRVEAKTFSVADHGMDPIWVDLTAGFDHLSQYRDRTVNRYLGATVGRYANRIAGASFVMGVKETVSTLAPNNNGTNCLHGGIDGFNFLMWEAQTVREGSDLVGVRFSRTSVDGEEGFPSEVRIHVTYSVITRGDGSEDLAMKFEAINTGRLPTHVSLVNHNYWNLNGLQADDTEYSDVQNHVLWLQCPFFAPADGILIPTGEILSVARDRTMDFFTAPKSIGQDIQNLDGTAQKGYDHAFIFAQRTTLSREERDDFYRQCAATRLPSWHLGYLKSPSSNIRADLYSTFPAVQVYTGNYMPSEAGQWVGHHGASITRRTAVCLEAQYLPDTPHRSHFPPTLLQPLERRVDWQVFAFTIPR